MKIENEAKTEKGYISKSLTIEKQGNDFKITGKAVPTGKKKEQNIEIIFTKNGLSALVGMWMAILEEEPK